MSVIKKFRITKIKNTKPLISLKKISLSFRKNHVILDNISLDISRGQVIGLLGPNGAGKTTTFYMITGMIRPNSGEIVIDKEKVTQLPMYKRARRGIAYLPQEASIVRSHPSQSNSLE